VHHRRSRDTAVTFLLVYSPLSGIASESHAIICWWHSSPGTIDETSDHINGAWLRIECFYGGTFGLLKIIFNKLSIAVFSPSPTLNIAIIHRFKKNYSYMQNPRYFHKFHAIIAPVFVHTTTFSSLNAPHASERCESNQQWRSTLEPHLIPSLDFVHNNTISWSTLAPLRSIKGST